jgi:hypothetical protein
MDGGGHVLSLNASGTGPRRLALLHDFQRYAAAGQARHDFEAAGEITIII